MPDPLIIGTRGSLLALTQSRQIATKLSRMSGVPVRLKEFKTQGDIHIDKPLFEMEGKDFFTRELDMALLSEEVDLVVHSYKDLSVERPEGIVLAAVCERKFPHDILLMKKEEGKKKLIVGTSSPRRVANLERSLSSLLPGSPLVKTKMMRGNVPTRLKKMRTSEYSGLVLALAGLERLAEEKESRLILEELIFDLDFMVLPLSLFPGAPAQGALAVECLGKRDDLLKICSLIDHHPTHLETQKEREAFAWYGGGCHLGVGIHVRNTGQEYLHIHKGEWKGSFIQKKWLSEQNLPGPGFIGLPPEKMDDTRFAYDHMIKKIPLEKDYSPLDGHYLVSSSYGIPAAVKMFAGGTLWASGERTMKKLASVGLRCHGSADGLGERSLAGLAKSQVLQILMDDLPWRVLTGETKSLLGESVVTYKKEVKEPSFEILEQLKKVKSFYWTSFDQYREYTRRFSFILKGRHCCGLGKTLENFTKGKIQATPLSGIEEFKRRIHGSIR